MRFFFNSLRYSEDMDLDATSITVDRLSTQVMKILQSVSFQESFVPFGILQIVPPDMAKAKQTETTQRFKVHLITTQGADLLTKVEFSRRGFSDEISVASVSKSILRAYRLPPLIVPHYNIRSAIRQKVSALATRTISQARDVFDLYLLSTQYDPEDRKPLDIEDNELHTAISNVYDISFTRFRDTVLAFLSAEDQIAADSPTHWDEIRLKVVDFINELRKKHE